LVGEPETVKGKFKEAIEEQANSGHLHALSGAPQNSPIIYNSPEGLFIQLSDKIEYDVQLFSHKKVQTTRRVGARNIRGAWHCGSQVVVAVRRSRQERRKLLAKLFPIFYRMLGALSDFPIPLNAGIFCLIDRQAVDSINAMRENNRYLPGLRARVGCSNTVVYYDRQDRAAGAGKLTFISRIKYAMDAITSFSYKPLRLCFALSALSCSLAAILGLSGLISSSALTAVGCRVAAAIFMVGGAMLLCLAMLGEYLGRVCDEVRQRPLSIINKVYYASDMAGALVDRSANEEEPAARILRIA
jgi:dolichol-phosphate mannosyltransferase